MIRRDLLRLQQTDAASILSDLTTRQHVRPHAHLLETLGDASQALGFTLAAAEGAIQSLGLDPSAAVGRLRRTQLIQLSRGIHRFWRRSIAESSERSEETPHIA